MKIILSGDTRKINAVPVSLTTLIFQLTDFSLLCCFIELLSLSFLAVCGGRLSDGQAQV